MNHSSHDDFSRTPVGGSNLRPWWYLLIIEMGVMISIPIFVFGGQLGLGLGVRDLLIATFGGAMILGVVAGLTARLGAITRCSTALIARITFGIKGWSFIAVLLALGLTGWWGVQTEMFARAVVALAQNIFHISLSRELMVVLGGGAMITTAALGIRAIGRLAYIAVPMLSMGLIYALITVFKLPGPSTLVLQYHPSNPTLGIGAAAAMVAGGFIVGAAVSPDISRFARTTGHAVAYALADYIIAYPLVLIACGIIAIGFHTNDIMIHMVPPNLAWVIFVFMMFATWAANDCNLYSSSLSLVATLPFAQRSHLAIMAGLFGICLAEFHVAEHMISFLTMLGILIAPIAGVFIANSLGRKHVVTSEELARAPNWRWGPLGAWASGAIVGFMSAPKEAFGLGMIQLTSVPPLDAVLVSAAVMLAIKLALRFTSRINIPVSYSLSSDAGQASIENHDLVSSRQE